MFKFINVVLRNPLLENSERRYRVIEKRWELEDRVEVLQRAIDYLEQFEDYDADRARWVHMREISRLEHQLKRLRYVMRCIETSYWGLVNQIRFHEKFKQSWPSC